MKGRRNMIETICPTYREKRLEGDYLEERLQYEKCRGKTGDLLYGIDDMGLRDLSLYYMILRAELATIQLTEGEACLILDACNGVYYVGHMIQVLVDDVKEAIETEGLEAKWNVDGPTLMTKLRHLTYAQLVAIVDAMERYWGDGTRSGSYAEQLRAIGMIA
jgi:hypothetical protein